MIKNYLQIEMFVLKCNKKNGFFIKEINHEKKNRTFDFRNALGP